MHAKPNNNGLIIFPITNNISIEFEDGETFLIDTPIAINGKERQKLAGATLEAQQKKEQGMSGLGETITEARQILTGTDPLTGTPGQKPLPTASGAGSLVDYLGNIVGQAPRGQNEAKRLEVVAAILTSKVPRMEGPQSDRDVELYKKAAGDAGNSGLPISTRLAALDTMQKVNFVIEIE